MNHLNKQNFGSIKKYHMHLEFCLDFHSAAPYISHVVTSLTNIMTQSFGAQWKGLFGVFMAASDVEIE